MQKLIKNLFDAQRKHFRKGGKLERLYAFFESMETVFFAPARVTQLVPHIRDHLDVKRYMASVVFMLLPLLLFGMYNVGYQAYAAKQLNPGHFWIFWFGFKTVLPLVIVSYVVGFAWEILFSAIRGHEISEGLFVTAMLFPLTLPPTTPLWQAALGISFGVVIGKEVFGGTGRNFLNPALTGRAFLYFAYPSQMSGDAVWTALVNFKAGAVDVVSAATPLVVAAEAKVHGAVEQVLADAGYTFNTLFFGLYPASIGASSAFLCLIAAIVLMILGIASYRIILGDILGILVMGFIVNLTAGESSAAYLSLNPFYHLIIGGAAFGIVFMSTDPVSAPDLHISRWIYGFLVGVLTVVIRVFNPAYPEGIMLAILFMNVFAPLLDHMVISIRLRNRIPNV
ncbi:MAG: NADH:ubiquinone reductase (Na(+)-transporting) subunit B [Desulfobacteraceae bacterium]|nr:NADH:ubiquinone reductase (Na(+)-transporting) subunit B [Desulfobacteraceae bacterium]